MTEADRFLEERRRRESVHPSTSATAEARAAGEGVPGVLPERAQKKALAIASLVCAIVGGWASTATIPAVICGHLALCRMKKNPQEYGGKGMAVAGVVIGYFGLGLAMLAGVTRGYTKAMIQMMMDGR